MKELVAQELARRVQDGEVLGVGTGSTVDLALQEIGKRVKNEKLSLKVVPTSLQSAWQCHALGLDVLYPEYRGELAWGFDGADEVDDRFMLIKGKGAAMLQEKILAARCKKFIVIVDESKIVRRLGERCAVPVEVVPSGYMLAERGLRELGATEVTLRNCSGGKHGPIITESGNIVLDAFFPVIPETLERDIKTITGVVESGIFTRLVSEVLVAGQSGVRSLLRPS
ncbi:MAG: ribose-5-phosphate isomerase RpiA [Proteobacteria bacterium]|nr:ribose-5-phosphate isomerase RpiA [Pseudomonadota bacterium]